MTIAHYSDRLEYPGGPLLKILYRQVTRKVQVLPSDFSLLSNLDLFWPGVLALLPSFYLSLFLPLSFETKFDNVLRRTSVPNMFVLLGISKFSSAIFKRLAVQVLLAVTTCLYLLQVLSQNRSELDLKHPVLVTVISLDGITNQHSEFRKSRLV